MVTSADLFLGKHSVLAHAPWWKTFTSFSAHTAYHEASIESIIPETISAEQSKKVQK